MYISNCINFSAHPITTMSPTSLHFALRDLQSICKRRKIHRWCSLEAQNFSGGYSCWWLQYMSYLHYYWQRYIQLSMNGVFKSVTNGTCKSKTVCLWTDNYRNHYESLVIFARKLLLLDETHDYVAVCVSSIFLWQRQGASLGFVDCASQLWRSRRLSFRPH